MMLINLRAYTKQNEQQVISLCLETRLPHQVHSPSSLNCIYLAKKVANYFLLTLTVRGQINIECQRCLQPFFYEYNNKTVLAVCDSEAQAEKLMHDYECIVTKNFCINLVELVTDELHLYSPENHLNINECDQEVSKFIDFSLIKEVN